MQLPNTKEVQQLPVTLIKATEYSSSFEVTAYKHTRYHSESDSNMHNIDLHHRDVIFYKPTC